MKSLPPTLEQDDDRKFSLKGNYDRMIGTN